MEPLMKVRRSMIFKMFCEEFNVQPEALARFLKEQGLTVVLDLYVRGSLQDMAEKADVPDMPKMRPEDKFHLALGKCVSEHFGIGTKYPLKRTK